MKNAVIVAAGQFPRREYPGYILESADITVCCDSALQILERHGIVPDAVVGDMDSVCSRALARFGGTKVKISEQETNDLTKAFRYVLDTWPDVTGISIIGATGRSEAHTIGNLGLLMQYEKDFGLCARGISVTMVSDYCTAFAIGDSCSFHVGKGRKVSLFCADPTLQIRSEGLVWPTGNVVFDAWWKASLNRACDDEVKLTLSHPCPVLVVLD